MLERQTHIRISSLVAVALLLGCEDSRTTPPSPPPAGSTVVTYVPVEEVGPVAVRISLPMEPRYPDGAGVVVDVAPFFTTVEDFYEDLDATPLGLIRVSYLWPGKESASTGVRSEGTFDYGGDLCIAALRDVIRFATGQIPDREGRSMSDMSPFPVLTDQVGLYAFSHPGIAAVRVLALHGDRLRVRYFVGRENPTVDAISAVELGYWDESGRPVLNPLYRYPDSYTPTSIDLDYSSVRFAFDHVYRQVPDTRGYPYFDLNGNERYDSGDFILSYKVPRMFGKRVYSTALTRALRDGGLGETDWPDDVATPEEAAELWATRTTPPLYPALAEKVPDLKVLLLFSRVGHVQPLPDRPQVHQAYDGFRHTAGLWTRLNPDGAYLPAGNFPGYRDHPANTEPDDWSSSDGWAYPKVRHGSILAPRAAVAEMADRTHEDAWEDDLTEAFYPLHVSPRCGDLACEGAESHESCPEDCASTGNGGGERLAFVLVHCDPQEILNLHDNYDATTFDYDRNGAYDGRDAWAALMDLVDLADSFDAPLTLQFSPPYLEFIRLPECDALLGAGRVYPKHGRGSTYTTCRDLVSAWAARGHELSIHHHGPNHDPLKFDGYTNREVYAVKGLRSCGPDDGPVCGCPQGRCYWCAPPGSSPSCRPYEGPPPGPVGTDTEWKGTIEGPGGMMELVEDVFGAHQATSFCSNHLDEVADVPSDPQVIYTTQGTGYLNTPADFPKCVAYDLERAFHDEPKYAWFYSHGLVNRREHLDEVKALVEDMLQEPRGTVLGIVFHVTDFLRSELADSTPHARVVRELFAYLADPPDEGGRVRIETLSALMARAARTRAPDPCIEDCFSLDETSPTASYTVPAPRPSACP